MVEDIQHAAAGLLLAGFPSAVVTDELRSLLKRGGGGVIVFERNIETVSQAADLINEIQALRADEVPLLVAVDQEGGRVSRLRAPVTEFPDLEVLGRTDDEELAERMGTVVAHELRRIGFNLNLAPVMDVNSNPDNPVIGPRSLSSDPYRVARLGCAIIRGMQQCGLLACAKHFPGHGDTSVDSHLQLPVLAHDMERLRSVELVPFEAAVRADVAAIMTAHVCQDALEPGVPATLSVKTVEGLLRRQMGYRGVVISDDLEMKAVLDHFGIEESVRRGLTAGIDLFLVCHDAERQELAFETLVRAAESSSTLRNRLMESATRVARLRERAGTYEPVDSAAVIHFLGTPEHRAVAEAIVRKGKKV